MTAMSSGEALRPARIGDQIEKTPRPSEPGAERGRGDADLLAMRADTSEMARTIAVEPPVDVRLDARGGGCVVRRRTTRARARRRRSRRARSAMIPPASSRRQLTWRSRMSMDGTRKAGYRKGKLV